MDSIAAQKPHAVLLPFPAQGHVNPFMQLAKLLHSRGFHVTFVNTEFNHRRLVRSQGPEAVKGLPDFCFETIPDGLPPSDCDATQDPPALCDSIRKNCLAPFIELLSKLDALSETPPVACVISDGVMSFGTKAARLLGIADAQFWTASACGLMGYLQYGEFIRRGIVPFKDESFLTDGTLDAPIDWVEGMSNIRFKDMPSFVRTTDIGDILFDYTKSETENCLNSSAIIFNTFDDFEEEVLDALAAKFPRLYTIGPLPLLEGQISESSEFKSMRPSLWKDDLKCLEWLDEREPDSVVYVNYGSVTVMTEQHLKEFARGLAKSKYPFLWIVRNDVVMGDSPKLPKEFLEEIKDRGFIANWCPQDKVLSHPSIGAFLTHCGWNSIMESICGIVPVICWPFFAEQQTNCRYACTSWGIGMEVNHDVKSEEIVDLLKEMMEGDNGKQMRQKALEWKRKAEEATNIGGSSYNNFNTFVKHIV
ncbi:linamarin synthase 1 [Ricinus communis]|uniref:Glycosyltransferase n=1 Tax=Ricinus communis TaxID=3988 RepID=B9RG58_RICCO|nr:linamarin synthase 1 [Ricinus communis]EEF49513.1 UDP-glucuronosyltransferase, putative [Ricinus communis]|eukprot:XP_002513010.1 linamarin synthase 1 [Ricinus communis]